MIPIVYLNFMLSLWSRYDCDIQSNTASYYTTDASLQVNESSLRYGTFFLPDQPSHLWTLSVFSDFLPTRRQHTIGVHNTQLKPTNNQTTRLFHPAIIVTMSNGNHHIRGSNTVRWWSFPHTVKSATNTTAPMRGNSILMNGLFQKLLLLLIIVVVFDILSQKTCRFV